MVRFGHHTPLAKQEGRGGGGGADGEVIQRDVSFGCKQHNMSLIDEYEIPSRSHSSSW